MKSVVNDIISIQQMVYYQLIAKVNLCSIFKQLIIVSISLKLKYSKFGLISQARKSKYLTVQYSTVQWNRLRTYCNVPRLSVIQYMQYKAVQYCDFCRYRM